MLRNNPIPFILAILILVSPFLFSQENPTKDYKIGPKDLLEIFVYGLSEFNNFPARVSEEGNITLPHIGEVEVEGLSQAELEKKLRDLFFNNDLLIDPQVIVNIAEHQSKIVYLDGAVRNPKTYDLIGPQRLMQIITRAGGLTSDAGDKIYIFRTHPDGTTSTLTISIDDLYMKGDADQNIPIQADDSIHVPIDKTVLIYVRGKVRNPGAIQVKMSNIPTLSQAIAAAGGFAERASKGNIKIHTTDEDGLPKIIKVNIKDIEKGKRKDIQLKENDVVIVPESFF
jgi:polysaccharide export outer membrane protein